MHLGKKTKIVATVGPATESVEKLEKMLKAGMNVMRMNFSHGDMSDHQKQLNNIRKLSKKLSIPCATMQDLSGPKFRLGDFRAECVNLKVGDCITLTSEQILGDASKVSVNYPTLHEDLSVGNIIMVDDGKIQLKVTEINDKDVICKVLVGGEIKSRRGINLPGVHLNINSLTEKDKKDLHFGIKNKVDIIAFSFVRTAEDVLELRSILNKAKSEAMVLSKIETQEAVDNIDEIIQASDAIMVARGDLAVEIGYENVPVVQKMIIRKCNEAGKPVITATQMLESMVTSPVPTRAEVSDIANAILDGTDAIMLSEESTLGEYPVEAVELMTHTALKTEESERERENLWGMHAHNIGVGHSTTLAAMEASEKVGAKYLVALTEFGYAARMLSRNRGLRPIIVLTPNPILFNQTCLIYGCYPILHKKYKNFDQALTEVKPILQKRGLVEKGNKLVIVSGIPFGKSEESNVMLIETV